MAKVNANDLTKKINKLDSEIQDLKKFDEEKKQSAEELDKIKKYLIEEVVDDGYSLVKEMESKRDITLDYDSPYKQLVNEYYDFDKGKYKKPTKKNFFGRLLDFIFK